MGYINCGSGYIYNPDSGKCIKSGGQTAKKVIKKFGQVSQYGECNGEVMQTPSGVSYCSSAGTIMQRKKREAARTVSAQSQVRVDDRIAEALREVKRTLVRKNERIRELRAHVNALSSSSKTRTTSLEKQLQACEKRVDSLISKVSKTKK